jgi:hypothetical protein
MSSEMAYLIVAGIFNGCGARAGNRHGADDGYAGEEQPPAATVSARR